MKFELAQKWIRMAFNSYLLVSIHSSDTFFIIHSNLKHQIPPSLCVQSSLSQLLIFCLGDSRRPRSSLSPSPFYSVSYQLLLDKAVIVFINPCQGFGRYFWDTVSINHTGVRTENIGDSLYSPPGPDWFGNWRFIVSIFSLFSAVGVFIRVCADSCHVRQHWRKHVKSVYVLRVHGVQEPARACASFLNDAFLPIVCSCSAHDVNVKPDQRLTPSHQLQNQKQALPLGSGSQSYLFCIPRVLLGFILRQRHKVAQYTL